MNHITHLLFLALKTCQNLNPGDARLEDITLAARYPSHQSKKVRDRFQYSNHRVVQFSGFTSSMFLFQQGRSHQSNQLILQKRLHGNLNDVHFQNVCTNVLAHSFLIFQNFYFQTCSCSIYYESGLQFDKCIVFLHFLQVIK